MRQGVRSLLVFACLLCTILIFPGPAPAAGAPQAKRSLTGTVTAPNGDALPHAEVVLRSADGRELSRQRVDEFGNFRFTGLPAGDYTIEASATGFASATRSGDDFDASADIAVTLRIAGVSESITVSERVALDMMGVPGSVALVEDAEIADSRAHNLQDVLGFVPGVMANARFGADEAKLSVRGSGLRNNFHHRGLNLLINGIPYSDADGFSDYESIDLMATESVQVWKGANALRYGGNSMGGAINFETHTGYTAAPVGAWLEGGSFGMFKGQVSSGGLFDDSDWYASFTDTELDGYRDHADQGRQRLFANFGHQMSDDTRIRFDLMYANVSELLPGALTRAQFEEDPRQAQGVNVTDDYGRFYDYVRIGGKMSHTIDAEQELAFSAFGDYRDMVHPIFQVLDNTTTTFGGDFVYRRNGALAGRGNRLTLGFASMVGGTDEQRFENDGGESGALIAQFENHASSYGFWFEDEVDLTPDLTLVVGGRADVATRRFDDLLLQDGDQSDDRTYTAFVPKLGFIWQARDAVQLFGNASRSYEPPLLLELTSFGNEAGFIDLDAQDTWQFEVGSRGRVNRWLQWDVAFFDAEIAHEIININVQPFPFAPFTVPSYRNIDDSRHLGIEAGTTVMLGGDALEGVGSLAWRTAYTWSSFRFVDDPEYGDNYLAGAPGNVLRMEWRYDHGSGFWVTPGLDWSITDYFVDSANTALNDAYTALSLNGGVDVGRFEIFVHLSNLTDADYAGTVQVDSAVGQYYEAADGRAGVVGVRWQLR